MNRHLYLKRGPAAGRSTGGGDSFLFGPMPTFLSDLSAPESGHSQG